MIEAEIERLLRMFPHFVPMTKVMSCEIFIKLVNIIPIPRTLLMGLKMCVCACEEEYFCDSFFTAKKSATNGQKNVKYKLELDRRIL